MTELDGLAMPWIGSALRHVNAIAKRDVLDFRFVGSKLGNRWNTPDFPALYLAGDPGVLVAEWGRHLEAYGEAVTVKRDVYRLHLSLKRVIDVRDPRVSSILSLPKDPHWIASSDQARIVAGRIRSGSLTQAMIVPSIAFLDDLTRWNLVVFLDRLPADTTSWITRVERIGPLSWDPGTP